ncbi:TetR/AcrR family transcriptional regulator [Bosea sp. MMO-172]|uniref:TetR/AcrR family transcriptional regulator n=1 Tax=Bosea sp. MMO-172 TaxID=3127885 RepID=UPI0030170CA6
MPKISDEKRAARRAQILEAAWACFQKEGLHATTMDDIIRASGLSAGAVYSYYPSKDELILAAVTTSLSGLTSLVIPLLQAMPAPAPATLLQQIAATIDQFTAREGYDLKRVALLGWAEAQRNERLRATMRGFYLAFRDLLEQALGRAADAGHLERSLSGKDAAKALLAMIVGFVVQDALLHDVEPEQLARGLAALAPLRRDD